MTDSQKLDAILKQLGDLTTWQENLSHHVEELGLHMGTVDARLTEVEKAINRVARKVGETGVPALGGGRPPRMSIAAKSGRTT